MIERRGTPSMTVRLATSRYCSLLLKQCRNLAERCPPPRDDALLAAGLGPKLTVREAVE